MQHVFSSTQHCLMEQWSEAGGGKRKERGEKMEEGRGKREEGQEGEGKGEGRRKKEGSEEEE